MNRYVIFLFLLSIQLPGQTWNNFTTSNSDLVDNYINALHRSPDDHVWIGTKNGLSMYNFDSWQNFTTEQGLINNQINDIASELQAGGYLAWIATDGGVSVAFVSAESGITIQNSYSKGSSPLVSDLVSSVALDTNLVKWFGTDQGVSVLTGDGWLSATEYDYLSSNLILDITSGPTGLMHIATKGGGVSRLRYDEVDGITSASNINVIWSALFSDTIYTVFIDEENIQWFGTGEGLFRHTGLETKLNWTVYRMEEGLPDNHVQAITQDTSGNLWVGTRNGACMLQGDQITVYTTENGLISNNITDIEIDKNGDIWFATDSGISRLSFNSTGIHEFKLPRQYTLSNFPNPFNSGTILQFSIPSSGSVSISIINLTGQIVRQFKPGIYPAGEHRIHWSGISHHGQKLPSGVYFAVMSFAGKTVTHKLVMLQ